MLPLLLDENFNQRILRGLKRRIPNLDYSVAQESGLGGESDRDVLAWAAERKYILVTTRSENHSAIRIRKSCREPADVRRDCR